MILKGEDLVKIKFQEEFGVQEVNEEHLFDFEAPGYLNE